MPGLGELAWAAIGLMLAIVSSFIEVSVPTAPWHWQETGFHLQGLGVRYQVAAVLLTGCLGGRNAAAIAQTSYLLLGLVGMPIFEGGGGLAYLAEPSAGYVVGFIPGGWYCGHLAFWRSRRRFDGPSDRAAPGRSARPVRLEWLTWSALAGLVLIHVVGLAWAALVHPTEWAAIAQTYSLSPFLGQLVLVCVVAVLAAIGRRVLVY